MKDVSWFSASEVSVHGQLALYFLGCEENLVGKNEEENSDFIAPWEGWVGERGMEEEDEKDEEKEKKRVKVTSPVARPPASPTWE